MLTVMCDQWNAVFGRTLAGAERRLANELRDVRIRWARRLPGKTAVMLIPQN